MSNEPTICFQFRTQLIEIDHCNECYVGCVECNRWTWRGSKLLIMKLPEPEIAALRRRLAEKKL